MSSEILGELEHERAIEENLLRNAESDIVQPSADHLLHLKKMRLQRELLEVDAELHKVNPELERQKTEQLRLAVGQHQSEKRITREVLKMNFEQMDLNLDKIALESEANK